MEGKQDLTVLLNRFIWVVIMRNLFDKLEQLFEWAFLNKKFWDLKVLSV